jgi:hypothetical protein
MLFLQNLLFVYDGVDIFEVVIAMVEYGPFILALNVLMLFTVRPSLRIPTALAFPVTLGFLTFCTILGSFHAAQVQIEVFQLTLCSSSTSPFLS